MIITESRLRRIIRDILNENDDFGEIVEAFPFSGPKVPTNPAMGRHDRSSRSRPIKYQDYEEFKMITKIDLDSVEFEPDPDPDEYSCFVLRLKTELPHYNNIDNNLVEIYIIDPDSLKEIVEDSKNLKFEEIMSDYFRKQVSTMLFKELWRKLTPGKGTRWDLKVGRVVDYHEEIISNLNEDLIVAIQKKYNKSFIEILLDYLNKQEDSQEYEAS